MATPTHLTISTSQSVSMYEPAEGDFEGGDTRGDGCMLSVSYALLPGENLPAVVAEKAVEVASLHAHVQRTIRLTRYELIDGQSPPFAANDPSSQHESQEAASRPLSDTSAPSVPGRICSNEPLITAPQRMAIEEHFRRIGYGAPEIGALLDARFCKQRLNDLSSRQANSLLQELRRLGAEPARPAYEHPQNPPLSGNGSHPPRKRRAA